MRRRASGAEKNESEGDKPEAIVGQKKHGVKKKGGRVETESRVIGPSKGGKKRRSREKGRFPPPLPGFPTAFVSSCFYRAYADKEGGGEARGGKGKPGTTVPPLRR